MLRSSMKYSRCYRLWKTGNIPEHKQLWIECLLKLFLLFKIQWSQFSLTQRLLLHCHNNDNRPSCHHSYTHQEKADSALTSIDIISKTLTGFSSCSNFEIIHTDIPHIAQLCGRIFATCWKSTCFLSNFLWLFWVQDSKSKALPNKHIKIQQKHFKIHEEFSFQLS